MIDLNCRIGPLALTHVLVALTHDVRNPLNTIMLQTERAHMRAGKQIPQDPHLLRTLDIVRREVERLDATLDAYLGTLGLPSAICRPTPLRTLIETVGQRASAYLAAGRLAIDLQTPDALWSLDLVLMSDALEILLERAIKRLSAETPIKLRVFEHGQSGLIAIGDAVANGNKLDVHLAVARQCIRAQGGAIRIELAAHAGAEPQVLVVMPLL